MARTSGTGSRNGVAPSMMTAANAPPTRSGLTPIASTASPTRVNSNGPTGVSKPATAAVAAPRSSTTPAPRTGPTSTPTHEQIGRRAYEVYLERCQRGQPGDAHSDWAQAEADLKRG